MNNEISSNLPSFGQRPLVDKNSCDAAIGYVLKKVEENLEAFTDKFPCAASENLIYHPVKNTGYDTGFWNGMLWLAYEVSGDISFRTAAEVQLESFQERLENNIEVNSINIGRLYTLSCVAAYKVTCSEKARKLAMGAADKLLERFSEKGQFIFGWGQPGFQEASVIEIPSLIDLSLLYWASTEKGDKRYYEAARKHLDKVIKYNTREDFSTYHRFLMDVITGEPLYGSNMLGYSDESCWSRGHALGIYSLVLHYVYTGDINLLDSAKKMANYFLSRLPEDGICYWDLFFTEGKEPRDTSAAAIAASGLLELSRYLPVTDSDKALYENAALKILATLMKEYTTNSEEYSDSNGILMGGVYRKTFSYGENECLLVGEYFYFEALIKASRCCRLYW